MKCGSNMYVRLEESDICAQCGREGYEEHLEHGVCCYCCQEIRIEEEERHLAIKVKDRKEIAVETPAKSKHLGEVLKTLSGIEKSYRRRKLVFNRQ
jgi:hypothetical protein